MLKLQKKKCVLTHIDVFSYSCSATTLTARGVRLNGI